MSHQTPCHRPESDPDDWYIRKDGRQYADDDLLTDEARLAILEEANRQELDGEARVTFIEKAEDRAEDDAKREALRRRRHAKEACHHDCYFRLQCLDLAIKNREFHGTWGGYYEEELSQIYAEQDRRNNH